MVDRTGAPETVLTVPHPAVEVVVITKTHGVGHEMGDSTLFEARRKQMRPGSCGVDCNVFPAVCF